MPAISPKTIEAVANAGFDVYMRHPDDSWLVFTDGARIGYLQNDRLGGLSLSTVHIPSTTHGTGFGIEQGLSESDLSRDKLTRAFVLAPSWAAWVDRVHKWKDFAQFHRANKFNSGYRLVRERADLNKPEPDA